MSIRVRVFKTLGDYVAIEVRAEDAVNVINIIKDGLNKGSEDVKDAIRMIQHFDTFYDIMRKKFKEYLTPRKDVNDILKKRVLIDKLRLIRRDDVKLVVVVFDRSISMDEILSVLLSRGIEIEKV